MGVFRLFHFYTSSNASNMSANEILGLQMSLIYDVLEPRLCFKWNSYELFKPQASNLIFFFKLASLSISSTILNSIFRLPYLLDSVNSYSFKFQ